MLVVTGRFAVEDVELESYFEIEVGGQRMDRHYMFTQRLLSRLVCGAPDMGRVMRIEDGRTEWVIPLYFSQFTRGNWQAPHHQRNLRSNIMFQQQHHDNKIESVVCRATVFDGVDDHMRRSQMIHQLQYTGFETLNGMFARIRLNFNQVCVGVYFALYERGTNQLLSECVLQRIALDLNGHKFIEVNSPRRIFGMCPQVNWEEQAQHSKQINVSCDAPSVLFPKEVWARVFAVLNAQDCSRLMRTCKALWRIGHYNVIWNGFFQRQCETLRGWYCLPFTDQLDYSMDGALNFSLIDNESLELTFEKEWNGKDIDVRVVTVGYNVLRSVEGMAALAFAM